MHNVSRIAAIALVLLATVLAVAAFGLGRRNAANQTAQITPAVVPPPPPANVARAVVAGQLLPAGQPIHASALREIGVDTPPAESYGQPELLVGQVPRIDIPEGTVITSSLMSNPLAMQLQPGERALAVPVDDITGVGSRVQPGDYVDVVLTVKMTDASPGVALSSEHPESRLLASRLRVLAFGTRDLPSVRNNTASKPESGNGAAHADAEAPPRMAVLAVPLAEVATRVPVLLGEVQADLYAEALALRESRTTDVATVAEAARAAQAGFARIPWRLVGEEGEAELAEEALTVRCIQTPDGGIPEAGSDADDLVCLIARSY